MAESKRITAILAQLDVLYPYDGTCFLHYETPFQLLVATILSAQCTDARVNQITPALFAQYPDAAAFAAADYDALCEAVRPAGFFRTKARHIQGCAQRILAQHGGELPSDLDALTALPGVGRKTANVVRGHIFGLAAVVVDTHVMRVSRRLGLTQNTDPVKIEYDLMAVLPQERWFAYNAQIITHGRQVCKARKPLCAGCELRGLCIGIA